MSRVFARARARAAEDSVPSRGAVAGTVTPADGQCKQGRHALSLLSATGDVIGDRHGAEVGRPEWRRPAGSGQLGAGVTTDH